jgi:hypothetical protein
MGARGRSNTCATPASDGPLFRAAHDAPPTPQRRAASGKRPWSRPPLADPNCGRLDVFNGLLLVPHLDAAFDKGFIMVDV